jgi:peptide/nickel transport system permease protein
MTRLVVRRFLAAVPLLLGVLTLVFLLVESAPGDPTGILLGERPVPPEVRERIVAAYGLDRPPVERYGRWLAAVVLRGEFGWSVSRGRPVARAIGDALPATLLLAGAALLIHLAAGTVLGVATARWRGRWPDHTLSTLSLVLYSMPAFWVGLMGILSLSLALPLFPPGATHSVGAEAWPPLERAADFLWHLALPAGILGLTSAAALGRFVRSGVLATLGEEFVRAARARGASGRRVLFGHALRNALLPAITLAGLSLPVLVSGSLVTEVVFAWPGMGRLAYEAILARDVPVVLAATMLSSLLVIGGNLAADLALAAADPRIRASFRGGPP